MWGWQHDWHSGGKIVDGRFYESVVLDEAAARALAADLLEWADRPTLAATLDPPKEQG